MVRSDRKATEFTPPAPGFDGQHALRPRQEGDLGREG
jgi:hypothetical protein